jgi:4-amino-4-deoxy-L-arabinose transferase-like glycosyltransferase
LSQQQAKHVGSAERQLSVPDSQVAIVGKASRSVAAAESLRAQESVEERKATHEPARAAWWLRLGTLAVLGLALAALVPTVGDFGLTWDEPAYRYSQLVSVQWWEQLRDARSANDFRELLDPATLLYFWPYGRFGIDFHPPLAPQLSLASYTVFGHWMKDIPARRMASVIEFALTIAIGFHFLARRYGAWAGVVMAGSILFMPRLYAQAHLLDTDTPGLLLWAATALAFWNGLHEPRGRRWRVAVGILLGLAFIEKMGAVMVVLPLLAWLVLGHVQLDLTRREVRCGWIDGLVTSVALLVPLLLAFQQILMLQQRLPPPAIADLFVHRPSSDLPGAFLAVPCLIWCVRRLVGWLRPGSAIWGVERPALETWTSILAFAPLVAWLGNPAWWRETFPRLAHYYTLSVGRENALPKIQIIYFGQIYDFSLPWHNGWVLLAITVPAGILAAGAIGLIWGIRQVRRDWLPVYFLLHFLTLPVIRMFPTPAHDGVRLFLPTFFFLAAFAAWGMNYLADALARVFRLRPWIPRSVLTAVVLGPAALALVQIHPYELSYYNELVGGPRGAWARGFELTYWYDAFNDKVLADLNRRLPPNAEVDFLNDKTDTSVIVFQEHQSLGHLRDDIRLTARGSDRFPYLWLLTQDSKAAALQRLLFAMRPWYTSRPPQLGGARVASVIDPIAVSRGWALQTLLDAPDPGGPPPPAAPEWVRQHMPWLARLWGDGLDKARRLTLNQAILDWSRDDPDGLLAAARALASRRPAQTDQKAQRLQALLTTEVDPKGRQVRHYMTERLLEIRPEALVEAVQMLLSHRQAIERVMTRYGYTDPDTIGGYIDRELPNPNIADAEQ